MKIFVNAGHKIGIDCGAVGYGLEEADVTYNVGQLVSGYLNQAGIATVFLQSNSLNGEDEDYDNPSICRTANYSGADFFISIHCNAANGAAKGTETLVYSPHGTSYQLAECIQNQIVNTFDTVDRGIKTRPDLAVLRGTDMPAILVELAFIDNEDDNELLAFRQDDFARAIARGVTDYIKEHD